MAILLRSHDLSVVAERSDHVLIMHEGHIVEQGPTAQVLASPQASYTRQLIQATLPIELNLHYQQSEPETRRTESTPPLLRVRNLHKSFTQKNKIRSEEHTSELQSR